MASGHIGQVLIASVCYFGRWHVQVSKMARTASNQENTCTAIPADNWRELRADAAALMLAAFGTIETHSTLTCPRTLARRARWHHWASVNTAVRSAPRREQEGK